MNDISQYKLNGVHGAFDAEKLEKDYSTLSEREVSHNKIVPGLEDAVKLCGLKDGQTVSFHHHFRGG
ncbi:MAG: hypothetical protein LBE14_00250, partial [Treponema sp.]|nr:hypothetical protein [Treponema sp.]